MRATNPLNSGASSSRTSRAAKEPEARGMGAIESEHAAVAKAAQGNSPFIPYHPDMARRQAGHETPPSMAYGQLGTSESTERLLPRAPERAAGSGINTAEDIPMQNMSPKARGKLRETPVDPSLQAVTKGGYAPLNARERLAEIPLNTPLASPRTSIESTDPFGLPLPVTSGKGKKKANAGDGNKNYLQQVNEEEKGIQKNSKKKGIAAAVVLGTVTFGGAAVSTLKNMGKL